MIKKEEQENKKLQNQDAYPSHDPFLIRKWIVASGVIVGILGCFLEWIPLRGTPQVGPPLNGIPFLQLTLYFCWVTLGDCLSHFVWKLKASAFSDEENLLKRQRVTGQELDHYFDTRRNIRMSSLLAATSVLGISLGFAFSDPLTVFCIVYILSTLLGILGVRIFSKRRRPRLIYRDRQYDYPPPWIQPFPKIEPELMEPTYYRHLRGEIGTLWK